MSLLKTFISALAVSGCAIDRGTSPYRHHDQSYTRIEDYEAPAGVFSLTPAVPNKVVCPHCEAVNRLGETHCKACGKRLSLAPVWVPCTECGKKGKLENGSECPACNGRGFIKQPEPGETESTNSDRA